MSYLLRRLVPFGDEAIEEFSGDGYERMGGRSVAHHVFQHRVVRRRLRFSLTAVFNDVSKHCIGTGRRCHVRISRPKPSYTEGYKRLTIHRSYLARRGSACRSDLY